jgi:hypothetical protein
MEVRHQKTDIRHSINMEVVPDPSAGIKTKFVPLYSRAGDYPGTVQQWRSQFQSPATSVALDIDMEFAPSSDEAWWEPSGFPSNVEVPKDYSLIWTKPDSSTDSFNAKHWTASKLDYTVSVKLHIRGIKAFDVKPGSWCVLVHIFCSLSKRRVLITDLTGTGTSPNYTAARVSL